MVSNKIKKLRKQKDVTDVVAFTTPYQPENYTQNIVKCFERQLIYIYVKYPLKNKRLAIILM